MKSIYYFKIKYVEELEKLARTGDKEAKEKIEDIYWLG